jgi:hypothetical protein
VLIITFKMITGAILRHVYGGSGTILGFKVRSVKRTRYPKMQKGGPSGPPPRKKLWNPA